MVIKKTNGKESLPKTDVFRETGLRYLGYAGSLGWVCRALFPFQVSSMISVAYVCADLFDKANEVASHGSAENQILLSAADTFAWHFLASFALPGIVLTGLRGLTMKLGSRPSKVRSRPFFLPCIICGFALPLISRPIDNMVDNFMDNYVRRRSHHDLEDGKCEDDQNSIKNRFGNKVNPKYIWFYEQSRDLNALELERYREKLKAQRMQNATRERTMADRNQSADAAAAAANTATATAALDLNEQGSSVKSEGLAQLVEKDSLEANQRDAAVQANKKQAPKIYEATESENMDDMNNKSVQADKTTKPRKRPKMEEQN